MSRARAAALGFLCIVAVALVGPASGPAGARVDLPASSYAFIRQVVWLLGGELTIEEGGQATTLSAGDSYAFGEPAHSSFINGSGSACAYVVAVSRR